MTKVNIVSGDITKIASSAIITAINPDGMWFGGVDGAISRSSGSMFHSQAIMAMPLEDGQIVFAQQTRPHEGQFEKVLFVVDSLKRPVYDLLLPVFKEADRLRLSSVNVPTVRTGVMSGVFESETEAIEGLARVITDIVASDPVNLTEINIVVYDNPGILRHLQELFRQ